MIAVNLFHMKRNIASAFGENTNSASKAHFHSLYEIMSPPILPPRTGSAVELSVGGKVLGRVISNNLEHGSS